MKKLIYLLVVIVALGLIVSGCIPVVPTSEKGNPKPELGPPEIVRGVFVDYGYSSPPWYPPEEETDRYQWAPKIRWDSDVLPLDCIVYTNDVLSGAFGAVLLAFEEWDGYISTDLYGMIDEDSTTPPPGAFLWDGNTISWMEIDGVGGIIGVCYYWYYTATKEMVEFDIVLDKDETWATNGISTAFDVQNIVTHELGHTLVLGDLRSPRDGALTMHAYTRLGDKVKRTLGLGDILGVQAIYGGL